MVANNIKKQLVIVMIILGSACFWYGTLMVVCADWRITNWHWAVRLLLVLLTLGSIKRLLQKIQ